MSVHHADVVGSLLAPREPAEVMSYTPAREVAPEELRALQDRAVDEAREDPKPLRDRIDEASRLHPRDQLGISTQCGFESGTNALLTAEEQEAKLTPVADVAPSVWAGVRS